MTDDPVLLRNAPRFRGQRIGLLGGSFNPAHEGHRHISLAAMKALGLDAVWWLVSPQNPLKASAGMAPQMVRVARAREVERHPAIFPTAIEARLNTRYTVDTLAALVAHHPQAHFIWLMGGDSLAGFHRWKDWKKLAKIMPIAVLPRPGYERACWSTPAGGWFASRRKPQNQARRWQTWRTPALVMLSMPLNASSATALRAADPQWSRRYSASVAAGQTSSSHNRRKVPTGG